MQYHTNIVGTPFYPVYRYKNFIFNGIGYTIRIKKDIKSGWLTGQCEQLPEAITQGRDIDDLMFMMEDAIKLVLECKRDETTVFDVCKQLDIPKPKIN